MNGPVIEIRSLNNVTIPPNGRRRLTEASLSTNRLKSQSIIRNPCRLFLLTCIFLSHTLRASADNPEATTAIPTTVDPCEACKLVVKSFERGLERTARGKYEGGDANWEEKNLKSYADSEVRLVEIQEDLCDEVKQGKAQCLLLAEESESDIEEWWFDQRKKNVRLHDYLCISRTKRCCNDGSYGPNCQRCPTCSGHGSCEGSGTRQGSGACICEPGYAGRDCESCSEDHYQVATNQADEFTCLKCDFACKGCNGPAASNCTECRRGFRREEAGGTCMDINECDLVLKGNGKAQRLCKGNTYCVNTNGNYKCSDCHESCSGCRGAGPGRCLSCSSGYQMDRRRHCIKDEEMELLTKIDGSGWRVLIFRPQLIHLIVYQTAVSLIIFRTILTVIRYAFGGHTRTTIILSIVCNFLCRHMVSTNLMDAYESAMTEVNSE